MFLIAFPGPFGLKPKRGRKSGGLQSSTHRASTVVLPIEGFRRRPAIDLPRRRRAAEALQEVRWFLDLEERRFDPVRCVEDLQSILRVYAILDVFEKFRPPNGGSVS